MFLSMHTYRFNSLAPFDGISLNTCHTPQTKTCPESDVKQLVCTTGVGVQERLHDTLVFTIQQ